MKPQSGTHAQGGLLRRAKTALKRFTILRLLYRYYFRLGVQQTLVRRPVFALFRAFGGRVLLREDLRKDAAALHLAEYGPEESVIAGDPVFVRPVSERTRVALSAFTLKIDRPFVVEIPDVGLVGHSALGFTKTGALIAETLPPYFTWRDIWDNAPASSLVLSRMRRAGVPRVERAFSLVNAWGNNYYHWLIDCLARLEGLEDYERRTGHRIPVIIPENPARYQTESLQLLGYGPERCVEWNGSHLGVGTLVASSFRRELRGEYYHRVSLAGLRWVRRTTLAALPPAAPGAVPLSPHVFVSRRPALARRIANEEDVMRALAPLGFAAYALEEMSFADQVRLFAQAKVVVAPHGAGMMNLAFSENAKVVELFGAFVHPSCSEIARGLGFPYGFLECRAPRGDIRGWDADLVVDVPALRELTGKMLG